MNSCWQTCWASQCQMSIHCGRSKEVLSPVWLYLQVTYCRVWKKTKETQIRADVESELMTKTNSPTTNAEPTRINIHEEMSVQERTLAKPHHGSRQGNTCVTFAQRLPLAWSTWSFFGINGCQGMAHYTTIWVWKHKQVAFLGLMSFNFIM